MNKFLRLPSRQIRSAPFAALRVALHAIERGASAPSFGTLKRLTLALDIPAAALFPAMPPGDNTGHPETERRARELAAMAVLARDFSAVDLELARAILTAIANAASKR